MVGDHRARVAVIHLFGDCAALLLKTGCDLIQVGLCLLHQLGQDVLAVVASERGPLPLLNRHYAQ